MISLWLKTSPYATFETLVEQLFKCSAAAGDALKVLQDHWKKEHTPGKNEAFNFVQKNCI